MNKKSKKKLCWNCEGEGNFHDETCGYCGVSLTPLSIGIEENSAPYRLINEPETSQQIPLSPYLPENPPPFEESETPLTAKKTFNSKNLEEISEDFNEDLKKTLLTLFMLFSGSLLFIFGLMILLFSENGQFILKWSDHYWYLYFIFAIPLLFFGCNFLKKLENL